MTVFSANPIIFFVIVIPLLLALMFFTRTQGHALILRVSKLLYAQCRLLSRASLKSAQRIRLRNHEVIKSLAEALMERQLERRFMRIEKLVEKDLSNYQLLAADINRQLVAIDEDYAASALVPEVSAQWVSAVDAIAQLQGDELNSEVMVKILSDMHQTIEHHHRDALREHRWTVASRHKVLSGIRPQWRKLAKLLQQIDNNIEVLRHRLRQVDQHMGQFEMVTAGSGQGIMSSILMRFISATCFVIVGIAAAWINWQLLFPSFQQVLPTVVGVNFSLPLVVASVHVTMCVVAAMMISESLRITHFFPLVTAMTRRGRQTMTMVGSGILLSLIGVEALVLMDAPLASASTQVGGISQTVVIVLGVILPLMMSLVVIPLEYLLHTVRPVIGSLMQLLLHVSAVLLRLLGSFILQAGKVLVGCYDLVIFIPLQIKSYMKSNKLQSSQLGVMEGDSDAVADESAKPVNVTELKFGSSKSERHH